MGSVDAYARFLFTAFLSGLFLTFFGYPALIKYLEKSVLIKVSIKSSSESGIPPPSVTICPLTPALPFPTGWKNSSGEFEHALEAECGNESKISSILGCIKNKTYSLNETFVQAFVGTRKKQSLMDASFWKVDLTHLAYGNCFMLQFRDYLISNWQNHSLNFYFNPNLVYDIFIHDFNFFLTTSNLKIVPGTRVRKILQDSGHNKQQQFDVYPLVVTERRSINRPEAPCNENPDFNFKSCITESLYEKVGCRYPWDQDNGSTLPICKTVEKIKELGKTSNKGLNILILF